MNSLIFRTISRFLMHIMIIFSWWILLRGHHLPGGGFIASLVAACAVVQYKVSIEGMAIRTFIHWKLVMIVFAILALLCAMIGFFMDGLFFKAQWWSHAFGSPLLFDVAVYGVVLSSVLMILHAMEDYSND